MAIAALPVMATIIAGIFETLKQAEAAAGALRNGGCVEDDVSIYHINAPGQHAKYPIGGDEDEDPGARQADTGAVKGALAGAGVGAGVGALVGGPVGAVAGAAAGAYAGAFGGALNSLGKDDTPGAPGSPVERRPAGTMVAVNASQGPSDELIVGVMREHAALSIEKTQGEWKDGQWIDFDPTSVPRFLVPTSSQQRLYSQL
jgi:outer membrane lipoprotein SlyB